ncbi:MAG: hypothetical protein ACI9LM_000226 [Alteromonadaceae bacterium]|jgi:hypothetical protein
MNLLKHPVKLAIIGFSLSALSTSVLAEDEVPYSTEGYCLSKKAGDSDNYLKAYANKLGQTPSKNACKSFNDFVENVRPKDWDYPGGKPYPGSVLRLTTKQIEKIKAAKKES